MVVGQLVEEKAEVAQGVVVVEAHVAGQEAEEAEAVEEGEQKEGTAAQVQVVILQVPDQAVQVVVGVRNQGQQSAIVEAEVEVIPVEDTVEVTVKQQKAVVPKDTVKNDGGLEVEVLAGVKARRGKTAAEVGALMKLM